jgi:hypothetical protein
MRPDIWAQVEGLFEDAFLNATNWSLFHISRCNYKGSIVGWSRTFVVSVFLTIFLPSLP